MAADAVGSPRVDRVAFDRLILERLADGRPIREIALLKIQIQHTPVGRRRGECRLLGSSELCSAAGCGVLGLVGIGCAASQVRLSTSFAS